jgi:hypothetical protein
LPKWNRPGKSVSQVIEGFPDPGALVASLFSATYFSYTGLEFAVVFPMLVYLLILYGAFSLLFVLAAGLFFSRIGKRFPLPSMLSEKIAPQEASPPEAEVLKRSRSRFPLVRSKAASRVPALSFSHTRAKVM